MTRLAKLPIGIQTFAKIREDDYAYVDKTPLVHTLIEEGNYYFLARPRRFGKSLLISTLQALFEGRKELFTGLDIEDKWDWGIQYPVIKISFGGVARSLEDMKQDVGNILEENQRRLGLSCKNPQDIGGCFKQLIWEAQQKYGQKVVILVDEYDKLIVDNLDQIEVAKQGREVLKDLYSIIKDSDEYIKFAFLTGVSKFSKVSVFSGLNNLKDISLDSRYATLCGYTQHDLETVFAEHLRGADMERVRQWYNGYNFLGDRVYNPFDILLFIDSGQIFDNYWFATGTPTFLIKLIRKNNYYIPKLDNLRVSKGLIDSYDIEDIELEPILFQSGYLSINHVEQTDFGTEYSLKFPNREVAISFNDVIVRYLTGSGNNLPTKKELLTSLKQGDLQQFENTLTGVFASIPYTNYVNNTIGSYEGYYASVVYAYLASLGLDLTAEDVTSKGRIDLTVKLGNRIYIIEFKVDGEGRALEQIKARGYHHKFQGTGKDIYLIGIDFDSEQRNIAGFEWEKG
ncbi:ATP-binding protein [Geoalkalibacter subterraneus]|uniref:ATP-binding protein n=1 Tax=Geoalkalibacter subterraneus TaxID=483547 RepID=UPI000AB1BC48|nr:ATP-binding protein [Geoalkalibacter subterraneus]